MNIAVVLLNLGGPDSPAAIGPFLRNLFRDPAILGVPWPLRPVLADFIASRRVKTATAIYAQLGGKSPILEQSLQQARALEKTLNGAELPEVAARYRTYVAMRYWHPMIEETARRILGDGPDKIILLPLYPQFSTTTTESSFSEWNRVCGQIGLRAPTARICCYPTQAGLVSAFADKIRAAIGTQDYASRRILFSAHGLPEKIVARGDPYPWQIEQTAAEVARRLAVPDLDWTVCYQSRVGPLKWIGPSTADEIVRAGKVGLGVVVVPIAFVSEHSETLVELDIEYRQLAEKAGVPSYLRVPTVGVAEAFIQGLATLVRTAETRDDAPAGENGRLCPVQFRRCVCGMTAQIPSAGVSPAGRGAPEQTLREAH